MKGVVIMSFTDIIKIIFAIICFAGSFVLLSIEQFVEVKSKKIKILLNFAVSIVLTLLGSIAYDLCSKMWYEETLRTGVLRGTYPYFVRTNAQYGNFCIELVQEEDMPTEGLEVFIGYVNSDYKTIIEWEYSEPIWINIEPMEYEVLIISKDQMYQKNIAVNVEKETSNRIIIGIYNDQRY